MPPTFGHDRAGSRRVDRRHAAGRAGCTTWPRPRARRTGWSSSRRRIAAEEGIARLGDDQLRALAADVDERHALLIDEALERREHLRVLRGIGDRLEELLRRRIAVGMALQVKAHALLELVVAKIGGDHRDDLAALAVGDVVERGVDLAVLGDRLVDRAADHQRVGVHRAEALVERADADVQLGPPLVADAVAHPVGEALVEPDVVPPGRGHEIAEPLVRQLVRDDHSERLLVAGRRARLQKDDAVAVGVGAGILHRAGHDRSADLIELGEREGLAEIFLEQADDARRLRHHIAHLVLLRLGRDRAVRHRRRALRVGRDHPGLVDERAGVERDEIGRQRQRRARTDASPARRATFVTDASGALLTATKPGCVVTETVNGVLKPGSSKPG